MAKAMSIAGLVVGGLIALTFTADLILGIPFGGRAGWLAAGFIICGGILAYLGWSAFTETK